MRFSILCRCHDGRFSSIVRRSAGIFSHSNWSRWFVGLCVVGTFGEFIPSGSTLEAVGVPVVVIPDGIDIGIASGGSVASARGVRWNLVLLLLLFE